MERVEIERKEGGKREGKTGDKEGERRGREERKGTDENLEEKGGGRRETHRHLDNRTDLCPDVSYMNEVTEPTSSTDRFLPFLIFFFIYL